MLVGDGHRMSACHDDCGIDPGAIKGVAFQAGGRGREVNIAYCCILQPFHIKEIAAAIQS